MITRSDVNDAKAFLCWEVFENLSIQLVPLSSSAAYYYPPHNKAHSIVLFIPDEQNDLSQSLFLLFHEAGHVQQYCDKSRPEVYDEKLEQPNGAERMAFERDAWQRGAVLFSKFMLSKNAFDEKLLKAFEGFARSCVDSYSAND